MDHIDRIGAALDYIEHHLTEDISLEEIARQANSSLFWFHSVFSLLVGDSLGEYLRKCRLNCAAVELVTSAQRIIDTQSNMDFPAMKPSPGLSPPILELHLPNIENQD